MFTTNAIPVITGDFTLYNTTLYNSCYLVDRAIAPTPKFFRILRSIGLVLLAISGTIIAAPVALPVALVSAAGYVAGALISAVG